MSTSLMYHAFGARTYDYLRTEYRHGTVLFHLAKKKEHQRCVQCRSRNVICEGVRTYRVRSVPIGKKPVVLVLHIHMLRCKDCGAVKQDSRDLADPRKSYTRYLANLALDLCILMTIKGVASYLQLGWDLVKSIIKQDLKRRAKKRSWRYVRHIAIDEISIRKGHKYMTVVVDLDTGRVLFAARGQDHECLRPFFVRLRRAHAKLEAICVDMSGAYLKAIELYAPEAVVVVHDHYHLVSNMNKVVDEVRRDEQNRLEDEGKKVIKGSRYLLLRSREKIKEMPRKQARLDALLAANETLHKVYLLKEDLRLFWRQDSKDRAESFIEDWIDNAKAMANAHVRTFAQTVKKRIDSILAWYDHPLSNGPLEGLNNKIKVLKRMAYGYRDMEFFKLRILFIHESEFNLAGV